SLTNGALLELIWNRYHLVGVNYSQAPTPDSVPDTARIGLGGVVESHLLPERYTMTTDTHGLTRMYNYSHGQGVYAGWSVHLLLRWCLLSPRDNLFKLITQDTGGGGPRGSFLGVKIDLPLVDGDRGLSAGHNQQVYDIYVPQFCVVNAE